MDCVIYRHICMSETYAKDINHDIGGFRSCINLLFVINKGTTSCYEYNTKVNDMSMT